MNCHFLLGSLNDVHLAVLDNFEEYVFPCCFKKLSTIVLFFISKVFLIYFILAEESFEMVTCFSCLMLLSSQILVLYCC